MPKINKNSAKDGDKVDDNFIQEKLQEHDKSLAKHDDKIQTLEKNIQLKFNSLMLTI